MDRRTALRRAGAIALLGSLTGCSGLFGNGRDGPGAGVTDDTPTLSADETATSVDHDPPVNDGPADQLGPDRFPTYWIGAIEGVETDTNESKRASRSTAPIA